MTYIFPIVESENALLTVAPIILVVLSGYTIGRLFSAVRKVHTVFLRDLLYGNLIINFLFISGFIVFGILFYAANIYFTAFTYAVIILSSFSIYFLLKKSTRSISKNILVALSSNPANLLILFGVFLFLSIVIYHAIVIYYHSIFGGEFDALYIFLPISKSILLGNGLNHDFYLGSDSYIRFAPFTQAISAWLIHSFTYSSLKLFPIYFVLFSSLFVYYIGRTISKDCFMGLVASMIFLITPSLLFVSSKYSLQEDLGLLFFLSASFYFLIEIIHNDKILKSHLIMLIVCISLLPLSREIGLVVSIAILFLVPSIKFTKHNIKLRAVFTVLSLLPFYILSFHDLSRYGFTTTITVRLLLVIFVNLSIFYILVQIKNQFQFHTLRKYIKYLVPLVIPSVFIISNIIMINGPYSVYAISHKVDLAATLDAKILNNPNKLLEDLSHALQHMPRFYILFISLQMGSILVFFKLRGLIKLFSDLKSNYQYAMILILLAFFLLVWSYLLDAGYRDESNRHLSYFIPLLSIVVVVGMNRMRLSYKLYYFGIIVFATYYFISHNLYIWNYNNIFSGFIIEPNKETIMTFTELGIGFALFIPLIISEAKMQSLFFWFKRHNVQKYLAFICITLLALQVYVLSTSGIQISPIQKADQYQHFEANWEGYVFEVINYLQCAGTGNVLGIRVPAIPFFTNRTNYDIYHLYSVASSYPIFTAKNSSDFNRDISQMNIRYIVVPNAKNNILYRYTQSLANNTKLIQILKADPSLVKISLDHFDIYEYRGSHFNKPQYASEKSTKMCKTNLS